MSTIEEIVKITYAFEKLRELDNKSFVLINNIIKELNKKNGAI